MSAENKPEVGIESNGQLFWNELLPPQGIYSLPLIHGINRGANHWIDNMLGLERRADHLRKIAQEMKAPKIIKVASTIAAVLLMGSAATDGALAEPIARLTGGRRRLLRS